MNFNEVTNVATSAQVGYRPNEKKEYVIGLGATGTQNVTFTFEISNKEACSMTIYNAKGEIVPLINDSLTLIAGTVITDYKIVVQNISSKQPFCKLTITKKVL